MKYILSWGGGVNSSAILAMMNLGMLPEVTKDNSVFIFADTGSEMPYTYEHTNECLSPMAKDGWKVKALRPYVDKKYYRKVIAGRTIYEFCWDKEMTPSRINRWCSDYWKSNPINNYIKEKFPGAITVLGIAKDEEHRARDYKAFYPLIDHNIDRVGCIELIGKAMLPEARKSGCSFCPFQRKAQWLELYKDFPDLFKEAEDLEARANTRWKREEKKGYYLRGELPIRENVKKWLKKEGQDCAQGELFEKYRSCMCE